MHLPSPVMALTKAIGLKLAGNGILENSVAGSLVGTLSAIDPSSATSITFALAPGNGTNDAGNSFVEIIGNQVKVKPGVSIDYVKNPVLNLNISLSIYGSTDSPFVQQFIVPVVDITPPIVSGAYRKGNSIILQFSQAVTAISMSNSAFKVTTVDANNKPVVCRISKITMDSKDPTLVVLTLSDISLGINLNLKVSYSDPAGNQTIGVIQDWAGNDALSFADLSVDTLISESSASLATHYKNLILIGNVDIAGTGNDSNNTIMGNDKNNILDGGLGADTLVGGGGDDTYLIDNTGDLIIEAENSGTDTVQSSISYVLGLNLENLTLSGSDALNGTGNSANNVIKGNAANNILDGGLGADTMVGGDGNDTYIVDNINDVIIESQDAGTDVVQSSVSYFLANNLENLTLTGGSANINGTGNSLNNFLKGNAGNNTLDAGAGDDILDGGIGSDRMLGGGGDDIYIVDSAGDFIVEEALAGIDTVQSSVTYALRDNLENLTMIGDSEINATGNVLNNVLKGNGGSNILDGGAGDDILDGGKGADKMLGGAGDDTYMVDNSNDSIVEYLNAGIDTVYASISYVLGENLENLSLAGGSAAINGTGNALNNVLIGNAGSNILDAGAGDDVLDGGKGADRMLGGAGDDTYVVDNSNDLIIEDLNAGIDTVKSSISYTLSANVERLILTGFDGINGTGNASDNSINGNIGNNVIDGGLGADAMAGGRGDDVYLVDNEGDVVIEQFNSGTDLIQSSVSWTLGANIELLTLIGVDAINGKGNIDNNIINGNVGNNVLDGGLGADVMAGGRGNDTYYVDNVGDVVEEVQNAGIDMVFSSITYALGANLENLSLTGTGAINGIGNALNNILVGNSSSNILTGGAGADVLTGLGGSDTFRYTSLADSNLASLDRITDFVIGTDILKGPAPISAANLLELGTVASLDQVGISEILTAGVFSANKAATFAFGSGIKARTFLAVNDNIAGFVSNSDGLIEITGYTGLLTNLSIA